MTRKSNLLVIGPIYNPGHLLHWLYQEGEGVTGNDVGAGGQGASFHLGQCGGKWGWGRNGQCDVVCGQQV